MENEAVHHVRQGRSCAQALSVGDGVFMLQATTQTTQGSSSRVRGVIYQVLKEMQFLVKLDDTGELIKMPRNCLYSEATQGGSVVATALSGNSKQRAVKNESRSASTSPTCSATSSDSAASSGRQSKRSRSDDENSSVERAPTSRRARPLSADGISSNGRCVTNASQHAAQQPVFASAAAAAVETVTTAEILTPSVTAMAAPVATVHAVAAARALAAAAAATPIADAAPAATAATPAAAVAVTAAAAAAPSTAPYGIPLIKTRCVSVTTHGARQELSAMLSTLPAAESVSDTLARLWSPDTNTLWKLVKVMEDVSESGVLSAEQCDRLCYLQVALAQRKDFPAAAAASAAAASSGKLAAIRSVLHVAYAACIHVVMWCCMNAL
jgi:hypothetical protein